MLICPQINILTLNQIIPFVRVYAVIANDVNRWG